MFLNKSQIWQTQIKKMFFEQISNTFLTNINIFMISQIKDKYKMFLNKSQMRF